MQCRRRSRRPRLYADVVRKHDRDRLAFDAMRRRLDRIRLRQQGCPCRDQRAADIPGTGLLAVRARIRAREEPDAGKDCETLERRARVVSTRAPSPVVPVRSIPGSSLSETTRSASWISSNDAGIRAWPAATATPRPPKDPKSFAWRGMTRAVCVKSYTSSATYATIDPRPSSRSTCRASR